MIHIYIYIYIYAIQVDQDKDGYLTVGEISKYLHAHPDIDSTHTQELIDFADVNGNF